MATAAAAARAGQMWRDDCCYPDHDTGECRRKYLLVAAVDSRSGLQDLDSGDLMAAGLRCP